MSARRRVARVLAALAFIVAPALSGCLGDGESAGDDGGPQDPTPPPGPAPPGEDCDVAAPLPVLPTWAAHGGAWGTFVQPDLAHPQGWRGTGQQEDTGLALLVDHASGPFADVDVSVGTALVSGSHPEGAGLVVHWTGPSYVIVRHSPSEGGWHAFTVIDGNRTKLQSTFEDQAGAPEWCQWTTLRVVAAGPDVEVFQDGRRVLTVKLPPEAPQSGHVGLFVRGDAVALFEAYQVTGTAATTT